jgi:hypothetical protein
MRRFFLPLLGVSFLLPALSQAAEWSLIGSVDQSLSYDDNVLMLSEGQAIDGSRGSFQYRIIPVLTFLHKTDVSEIHADALYGTQIYTDIEGLDQDIQNYGVGGTYRTQRFDWNFSANYSITPSRNTAIQNSGVFNTNSDSTTWSVSPSVSYKINAINSLILSPSYSETSFSASPATTNQGVFNNNFNNSKTTTIDLAWRRLWSENYSSAVSLFYSMFESQQPTLTNQNSLAPSRFDSVGINFSNDYSWSKNLRFTGTVGGRHTESTIGSDSSDSFGFLADVGANYTRELFSTGLHFNRALIPSNLGQLQEQSSVSFYFNYKIIERLSSAFSISYQESTSVDSINSSDSSNRKNLVLQPSITWQVAPEWTLGSSYRYRFQDGRLSDNSIDTISGEADSNLFMITLNYRWQGLRASR